MFALLFLLITLMVQTGVSGSKCAHGWHKHGKQCVVYMSKPKNHADAQADCRDLGANLVSLHSAEDYRELRHLIWHLTNGEGKTWIGAVDRTKNNKWTWVDGSKFDFAFWCVGQPSGKGRKNCVHSVKKCWEDEECAFTHPYICAK